LPDVPSKKEMMVSGNDLGKTDAILLAKIEELFLHSIEMNNKIKELSQQNSNMENEISSLKSHISKIERKNLKEQKKTIKK